MINIRVARASDAAPLAAMLEEAIRATYGPIAQASVYEAVIAQTCTPPAMVAAIEAAAADGGGHFLVAEPVPRAFLEFGDDGDGGLELRRLYAAVGETGRGVGSRLLAELEARLEPGTIYTAMVHAANVRGLVFWARHGFIEVGQVDTRDHFSKHRGIGFDHISGPEPAVVLRRVVGAS
jgi:GNAT superfamily N-acetyltransferase